MADTDGPTGPVSGKRKRKLDTVWDNFIAQFEDGDRLKRAYHSLCFDKRNPLIAQEITSCNAAAGYGVNFSRASCETRPYADEIYPFGSVFVGAVRLLNDFFTKPNHVPEDTIAVSLLEKLIQFLTDEESLSALRKVQRRNVCETDTMIVMAEHLFSRLSLSDTYTVDQSVKHKASCLCKCGSCKPEKVLSCFADTSVGNPNGWHGSLDIILGSTESFVHVVSAEEEPISGDKAFTDLKGVEDRGFRSQALAQVIVFSLLKKQRQSDLDHFLTPCIATTRNEIKVYMYDSKHDILLESTGIKLFVEMPGSRSPLLNYEAVLAIWFVLNYKYLCSGPHEAVLRAPKAKFFTHVSSYLEIYEKELTFKNVEEESTDADYEFLYITDPKFTWPTDLPYRPIDSERN